MPQINKFYLIIFVAFLQGCTGLSYKEPTEGEIASIKFVTSLPYSQWSVSVYDEASNCSGKKAVHTKPEDSAVKFNAARQIAFTFNGNLGMFGMNKIFCPVTFSFTPRAGGKYVAEYFANEIKRKCTVSLVEQIDGVTKHINIDIRKPSDSSDASYCKKL